MPALRNGLIGTAAIFTVLATAWTAAAVYWSNLPQPFATIGAVAFPVVVAAAFLVLPRRGRTFVGFCLVFALIVWWWSRIPASNEGDWRPDVAELASAEIDGDRVLVRNIRNCLYRTEFDYDVRRYDKTVDLRELRGVDLIAVYWMGKTIAHIMLSFDFGDSGRIAISIETRMRKDQEYGTLQGIFKQYALVYVVADERDVIRLRTNFRRLEESVHVFETRITRENAKKLFLSYMHRINRLTVRPMFYNTITTNCSTNVIRHIESYGGKARWNWKILLSGYAPLYAYEMGALDASLGYDELFAKSRVNERAHAAGDSPDFSRLIRTVETEKRGGKI